jgi:hypothetical protein
VFTTELDPGKGDFPEVPGKVDLSVLAGCSLGTSAAKTNLVTVGSQNHLQREQPL